MSGGLNSCHSEITVNGELPDAVGTEKKGLTWIADGCAIIIGRRLIRQPVKMQATFPTGEPSLGLHIPVAGRLMASLAGAGSVAESERAYGLNWVNGSVADVEYDHVTPGAYQTHLFICSGSYLRRILGGIRRPRLMDSFLCEKAQSTLTTVNATAMIRGIPQLVRSNPYDGDLSRLYLQGQVFNLMAGVMSDLEEASGRDQSHSDRANAKIRAVCDMLRSDLGRLPPIELLAASVGLSLRQLGRTFRAATGRTLLGWVVERRLEEAARLLVDGGLPIKVVSHRAGYAHVASFTSAFTRHFGTPPSEYRRMRISRHVAPGWVTGQE